MTISVIVSYNISENKNYYLIGKCIENPEFE